MKKNTLASLLGLLAVLPVYAQDTLHSDDVVVTASRIAQSREHVLADVTVIDREEIERAGQSTLVELLQRQPGIEIFSNGGAGKNSSIFLRGTNADHVVILVDGLRINSATAGTTSVEHIPLSQIEHIEILRGPASSLYGADAIGGVIQIFTRRSDGSPHVTAFAGYGSHQTRRAEAGFSGSKENTRYALNASTLGTEGFSAKKVATGLDADNDPYRNLSLSASLTQRLAEGHELGVQIFQSRGNSDYDCNKSICEIDSTLRSYGLSSRNRFLPFWNSTLQLGMGIDDSTDRAGTARSKFRTEQRQITWQNDVTLPLGTLTLAYDRLEQQVSGTSNYAIKSRDNNGWMASYLADTGAHSAQFSLRRDDNTRYGDHTTGGAAYGYLFAPRWRATASVGTAFKAPTFNQLYFPNFGNPALRPETSRNREAALRYDGHGTNASLTLFDNEIKNLIEFSGPAAGTCTLSGFCPVNVGKARIRGMTFSGDWHLSSHWVLDGNLTVQSPRNEATDKLLIRRGQRHGALNLSYQAGAFRAGAEIVGTSERFNNAANSKRMDGYALLNLTASYAFHDNWQLEARANNVLDKDYVLAYTGSTATSPPYETSGANLFFGLRYQPE